MSLINYAGRGFAKVFGSPSKASVRGIITKGVTGSLQAHRLANRRSDKDWLIDESLEARQAAG